MSALTQAISGFYRGRWGMSKTVDVLQSRQKKNLASYLKYLQQHSPYYRDKLNGLHDDNALDIFQQLPIVSKSEWLNHFDTSNTASLNAQTVLEVARTAEQQRDFSSTYNGYTVGLSSGTTGSRGFFVVSAEEQARWSGFILSQMLPRSLWRKERVAFFLRANSRLYESISTPTIAFQFFDLLASFSALEHQLREYKPTIVVAPSQVLRRILLFTHMYPELHTVINVAEIFDTQTKRMAMRTGIRAAEVYQATEGLLATTCAYGSLHMNEEHLIVEKEYVSAGRFIPIITDMFRRVQPIVRYRLNDILCESSSPCLCGRPHLRIEHIEGRQDDQLMFGSGNDEKFVFADGLSRIVANTLPLTAQYEIIQQGTTLTLRSEADVHTMFALGKAVELYLLEQGITKAMYDMVLCPDSSFVIEDSQAQTKRRRIRRIA